MKPTTPDHTSKITSAVNLPGRLAAALRQANLIGDTAEADRLAKELSYVSPAPSLSEVSARLKTLTA